MSDLIHHPSIIFVIGGRGEGKSAVGHYILEKLHIKEDIPVFILSPPKIHKKLVTLIPKWLNVIDNVEEAPENCIILIDEASLSYHCHHWQKKETEVMENLISISRHRKQTIIFITHTLRKISITLLDGSVLLCKQPGLFHKYTERKGFKKITELVEKEYQNLPVDDRKKNSYLFSKEYKGFISTPLCSYWSEELSEVFSGIDINGEEEAVDDESQTVNHKPHTIECGLKLWFKPEYKTEILNILGKNSEIEGILHPGSVLCAGGKCYYCLDLKREPDMKYHVSKKWHIPASLDEFNSKNIKVVIDIETAYPLEKDEVELETYKPEEKTDEEDDDDRLEKYAENVKL